MKKHVVIAIAVAIFAVSMSGSFLWLTWSSHEHEEMRSMHGEGHGEAVNGSAEHSNARNVESLPEAQSPVILEVKDGDRISLNPTLVKKTINGKTYAMYGYNGQIPGPIITAKQGGTITVDVKNDIDAATTVHWHGLRLDNANDGVPDLTQKPIEPGRNHTYTVTLPDEGVYWYHPHIREDIQQDMGLYGNLFVSADDPEAYPPANSEQFTVLDDLLIDTDGDRPAYGRTGATHPLMGRFGNVMLVNGMPASEYVVSAKKGSVVRFRLTNVANTRTFRWTIPGVKMKLVASDLGRFERAQWTDGVTIAPAERYTVDAYFDESGTFAIEHRSPVASYDLGRVIVSEERAEPSYADGFAELDEFDDVRSTIDPFRSHFDDPIKHTLRLSVSMHAMNHGMGHASDDGIEWEDSMPGMNAMMGDTHVKWKLIDAETGKANMDIDWKFRTGDIVKIRVINEEKSPHPMHHPIHFHGQRFLVLSRNGTTNDNLVWKDTVLIPKGEYVDLLFDMSNPGEWMFHCHIAEHLTNGMMGMLSVE